MRTAIRTTALALSVMLGAAALAAPGAHAFGLGDVTGAVKGAVSRVAGDAKNTAKIVGGKAKSAAESVSGHLKDVGRTAGKNIARNARIVGRNARDFGTSAAQGVKDIAKGIYAAECALARASCDGFRPRGANPAPKPDRVRARPGRSEADRVSARPGTPRRNAERARARSQPAANPGMKIAPGRGARTANRFGLDRRSGRGQRRR